MMKTIRKHMSFFKWPVVLAGLFLLAGCQEDFWTDDYVPYEDSSPLGQAQRWYRQAQNREEVLLSAPGTRSGGSPLFFTEPSWKYYTVSHQGDYTAVEVSLTDRIGLDFVTADQNFFSLILVFPLAIFAQTGMPIYTIDNGYINANNQFIDEENTRVASLPYTTNTHLLSFVSGTLYTIQTGRFAGWENEPGDFDVIEIAKSGQQPQIIYRDYDGIVRTDDSENLYSSRFNSYTSNSHFIEVPLTETSTALLFLGQHYGTDLSRLIIFILTDSDVKLVHNKQMEVISIHTDENFSMDLQSNIVEMGFEDEALTHTIYQQDGILYFKNN